MAVQLAYHGTKSPISQIQSQGFKTGSLKSIAPGQVFMSNNPAFSAGYGSQIKMASPTNTFSLPSKNFATGAIGKEMITTPKGATKMMNLAGKLGTKYTGPTSARLLANQVVSGLGGAVPTLTTLGKYASPLSWGATTGQGLGFLANEYAKATNSPEAYAFLKSMGGANFNFDETNLDVGDIFSTIRKLNQKEKIKKQTDVFKKIKEKQLADAAAAAKTKADAAAAKEAAQKAATKKQAAQNKKNKTGGYQSSHGGNKGFMGGKGTAAEMGSFAQGGIIDKPLMGRSRDI